MQCALSSLLGLLVLGCLLRVAAAGGGFLVGAATSKAGCVANGEACQEGVDCCGVCAYIGAETWRCQACTPLGEECIPMGNRCCDGGDRQKDVHLSGPKHECKATDELSSKYGTTKYTCQAAALVNVSVPAVAPEVVLPQPLTEQQGSEERAESNQCTPDGEACKDGVDCCGVCAYIGAETWRCQACTPLGEECIPMGNRCCDGGDRQKDVHLSGPKHECKATDELSSKYGTTKYTCQAAALVNVTMPAVAPEVVLPQPLTEQQGSEERAESNQCTPDGEACKDGVDCCGVCAYIGAETWRCQACTPLGEECIPMGNRCCDGGDRQKDVHLSGPKHECKATDELSSKYGTTKYTCQAAALVDVTMPAVAPEVVLPQPLTEQQGSEERAESKQCTPNGEVCKLGVDCCGVCVFMGRGSECRTCVAPGGACFGPNSNPCCGGATKRYDQGIVDPAYTCQSTGQKVGGYGIEQYTCQPAKP